MFIADLNDVWDICMINGILRKQKYHQILKKGVLWNLGKANVFVEDGL